MGVNQAKQHTMAESASRTVVSNWWYLGCCPVIASRGHLLPGSKTMLQTVVEGSAQYAELQNKVFMLEKAHPLALASYCHL